MKNTRGITRPIGACIGLVLTAGLLAACTSAPSGGPSIGEPGTNFDGMTLEQLEVAATEEGELIVYESSAQGVVDGLKSLWDKQYPEIELKMIRGDQGEMRSRFLAETQGGRYSADVVTVDAISQAELAAQDLIVDYEPIDAASMMNENAYAELSNGIGLPWRGIGLGFAYNTNQITSPPTSWADLLEQDTMVWSDPRVGGATYRMFVQVDEKFGQEYLKEIGSKSQIRTGVVPLHDAVASGEVPLFVGAFSYITLGLKADGAPIEWIAPEDGVSMAWIQQALAKNAQHPAAARLWANFLISEDVQKWLDVEHSFIPVNKNVDISNPTMKAAASPSQEVFPGPDNEDVVDTRKWIAIMEQVFGF